MSADKSPPAAGASARARLFFALWPTPAAAASLVAIGGEVAGRQGGKVTRAETVHLTLAFLGEVPLASLQAIEEAARSVRVPPFCIALNRLESWPRQRLLVARCDCPPALAELVRQLREALATKALLPAHADLPFKPHVTLVRKLPPAVAGGQPAAPMSGDGGHWPAPAEIRPQVWDCERFVLARSRLSPSGSDYAIVAEFPLAG